MSDKVVAYLSHARVDGELSELSEALVNHFEANDAELIHDTDSDRMNRSVGGFIQKLMDANVVVFLLNERFFKRHWCVHELTECVSGRNMPENHVVILRSEDWLENESAADAYLRTDLTETQLEYWVDFQKNTKDDKHRDIGKNNEKLIQQTLEFVSGLDLPKINPQSDLQGVLDQVSILNKRSRMAATVKPHNSDDYKEACVSQIAGFFRLFPEIVPDLAEVTQKEKEDHIGIARNLIVNSENEQRLDLCRSALMQHCSRISGEELDRPKISQFVGLLLLTIVGLEKENTGNAVDIPAIDLKEQDVYAASLFVSRLQSNPGTDLTYSEGRILAKGEYKVGSKESGDPNPIASQLKVLWIYEFPGVTIPNDDELLERLNYQMRDNFVDGLPRYLIIERGSVLDKPDFLAELKSMLPLLFIFRTGSSDSARAGVLSADLSGRSLGDILRRFEQILSGAIG